MRPLRHLPPFSVLPSWVLLLLVSVCVLAACPAAWGQQSKQARKDSLRPKPGNSTLPPGQDEPKGVRIPLLDILDIYLTTKDSVNHLYVAEYDRILSPRLYFGGKVATFGITPSNDYVENIQYYPNVRTSIGLGAFYGIYGLSFSYSFNNNTEERKKIYGETNYFDGAFNSYQVSYGYDLFYQSYRGFFQAKPQSLVSPTTPDAGEGATFPQRRDIVLRNGGFNYYKIYNYEKFSMQAAFPQVRRQLRSAGSWLHMTGAYYQTISGDSAINAPLAKDFNRDRDTTQAAFTHGRFLTITLSPGYGHTFVLKRVFVSGVLFFGPGIQLQNLRYNTNNDIFFSPFIRTNFRGSLGYNADRFFCSVQLMYDRSRNYVEGLRLQFTTNSYSLQAGYRF